MTHAESRKRAAQVVEAVRSEHLTLGEAAQRFRLNYSTVARLCDTAGVSPKRKQGIRLDAKCDPYLVLVKLQSSGKRAGAQIAKECGLTRERVRQLKERARELGLLNADANKRKAGR